MGRQLERGRGWVEGRRGEYSGREGMRMKDGRERRIRGR